MATIFLSHSGTDKQIAEKFRNQLEQMNSQVYMFEHDLQPGRSIASKVEQEINNSDIVFVLLTQQSQFSAYVHQEIGYARKAGKHVVPLVEAGTGQDALGMLTGEEHLNFDPSNPDKSVSEAQTYVHNHDMQKLLVVAGLILFAVAALCVLGYYAYSSSAHA